LPSPDELLKKYLTCMELALREFKFTELVEAKGLMNEASRVLDLAKRYYLDAKHYGEQGDALTGIVCIAYGEGLMDALRIMGLASFKWPFERRGG